MNAMLLFKTMATASLMLIAIVIGTLCGPDKWLVALKYASGAVAVCLLVCCALAVWSL